MTDRRTFEEMRELRINHELTRPQLSRLSGVSISTIFRVENGQAISDISIRKLLRALETEGKKVEEKDDEPVRCIQ